MYVLIKTQINSHFVTHIEASQEKKVKEPQASLHQPAVSSFGFRLHAAAESATLGSTELPCGQGPGCRLWKRPCSDAAFLTTLAKEQDKVNGL